MRFTTFKTPRPKEFSYRPRYFDKGKEERERRKAEMGYESDLGKYDGLRSKMAYRWRKGGDEEKKSRPFVTLLSYLIYATIVFGSIYFIFLTDFVDNLVALFGVGKAK
jgi:hypothetical protein